ncbi:chorismate--pyruvate lyase family protein [Saccharobesus litoralis]|uniref:chorismate--pyruvate lyase family protein n=1 Tax=Saccharobesus litoralis TaxID=2172099 RepID=UPI00131F0BCE|nr:chorismate lyase [Saccharobesus litoralis]
MSNLLYPIPLKPHWLAKNSELLSQCDQVSDQLQDWLFDQSSLTARLKAHCQQFQVEVVFEQSISHAAINEIIPEQLIDQEYWQRQVLLYCDGKPWVFASTLIPQSTLHKGNGFLAALGDKPLGEALFNHRAVTRGEIEVAPFPEFEPSLSREQVIWGRRSIFEISAWPLMVSEIFLPDCVAYVEFE